MPELHHASMFEAISDVIPEATALAQGDRSVTWREMDTRAARLSQVLIDHGLTTQSKVAIDLYNCLEWMECWYGALKGRFVPVSFSYRYLDDELAYLLDNSDAEALIFHASLADRIVRVAKRAPLVKVLIQVDDVGGAPLPEGVLDYDDVVGTATPAERISRSSDDLTMWYSGGTTGLPKGLRIPLGPTLTSTTSPEMRIRTLGLWGTDPSTLPADPVEHVKQLWAQGGRPIAIPAAPLMHSTALSYAGHVILLSGGMVATLVNHSFDAHELFEVVDRHHVTTIAIVGDAFAKPMVRALDARAEQGHGYDASSVRTIYSAGVAWSATVKEKLFEHMPGVYLVDNCGSSEGAWFGTSVLRKGDPTHSTRFMPAPGVLVLDDEGRPLPPDAIGRQGLLASTTSMQGYYKDDAKTKQNFRMIDGVWYTTPGDLGAFNEDGTITLIGRGSSVINTGGEKVSPEEVDDVIKQMDEIDDCLVVGTPDERWGQAVTAVVQLRSGGSLEPPAITDWVKARLAAYKAPRKVVFVAKVPRLPNGKPDYPAARELAVRGLNDAVSTDQTSV